MRSAIRLDSSRRTPSRFGFRSVGRKSDEKTRRPPKTKRKEEKRKKQRRIISSGARCARRMENSPAADVTVKESFCTDPRIGGKRCQAQVSESERAPPLLKVEENVAVSLVRISSSSISIVFVFISLLSRR